MTNESYLGNQNLKKSNVRVPWTQEQVKEFIKCSKDPIYFIKSYIQIVNIDRGLIPFDLYSFQEEIVNLVGSDRFVICKMPRQSGKTTTIAAMLLWYVIFNENYNVAILANKMAQAREILSRIQLAYEHLPKWLQQGVLEWNKGNIELENGSKILASATSSSAIRGGSFNLIYLDEFAFVPNNIQDEFFSSVYPTISSGQTSKVLITSTPNGMNMFYKIWVDSEEGRNSYKRIDVHWSDVPGRDDKWKEETIKNTSEDQFRVEFECEFVGSANTLISPSKLRQLTFVSPIVTKEHLKIYQEPGDGSYMIVVDTSRGSGIDYSAFVVFDITQVPYKVVAVFKDNLISSLMYPTVIHNVAQYYNQAYCLIEINDIGQQVADILHMDLEYENILYTGMKGRGGVQLGAGFGNVKPHLGVRTTKTVKGVGCSNLKSLVESDKIMINDYDVLQELTRFTQHRTSYAAEEGTHDDLVMCLVLFAWAVRQEYFKELTDHDIRSTLEQENMRFAEDQLTPFGIIDNHVDQLELEEQLREPDWEWSEKVAEYRPSNLWN